MHEDVHYYAQRASEERLAAMRSEHLNARVAHVEMARRYQELVDVISRRTLDIRFDVAGAA
jgi:hypothetical protein